MSDVTLLVSPLGLGYLAVPVAPMDFAIFCRFQITAPTLDDLIMRVIAVSCDYPPDIDGINLKFKLRKTTDPTDSPA